MSRQIAVRLPDNLVEFIDQVVERGEARGRAVVVARAVEREMRRAVAARDVAILVRATSDDDLDELARFAARTPMGDLD